MATLPNSRPDAEFAGVIHFDGGKKNIVTGITSYEVSDGSRAVYGTSREFELTIKLATGEDVHIRVALKFCSRCGAEFELGETKNYCNQCGSKQ
ncbi:MAG: hypothetical protein LH614_07860 [Pyrinomonadaceae bacterium]|nr:hypothetical protein [Pyrinomonadaceae bacterium]